MLGPNSTAAQDWIANPTSVRGPHNREPRRAHGQCFRCIPSQGPHIVRQVAMCPFDKQEAWTPEELNSLPKVIQLASDRDKAKHKTKRTNSRVPVLSIMGEHHSPCIGFHLTHNNSVRWGATHNHSCRYKERAMYLTWMAVEESWLYLTRELKHLQSKNALRRDWVSPKQCIPQFWKNRTLLRILLGRGKCLHLLFWASQRRRM